MGATPSVESAARGAKSSGVLEFLKSGPKKLLIGGRWVPSKSGKTFETLNPANEEGKWPSMSPHGRTGILLKIAELIDQHAEELAELETLDNGKPIFESKN